MKAAIIDRYGSAEVLRVTEVEKPQIKPNQMLVKVDASSINPVDWKIRSGMLKLLLGNRFPMILGFDVSGEVVAVGGQVTQFKPGDLVYAHTGQLTGGAYAEYTAVSEQTAAAKPINMTYSQAAAVPLAALTALQALRSEGNLKPGQTVLINGASGGVGIFAVQIAKVLGAQVTAVCGTSNIELVNSLGCDVWRQAADARRLATASLTRLRVIDYKQLDFTKDTAKYDIIFDVVGNRSLSECRNVLQPNGIYITTQPTPGNYLKSFLTLLIPGQKTKVILLKPSGADLAYLKEQIEAGKIRAVIDRIYPLSEIAAAHTYSETERAVGKIVIEVATS